MVKRRLNITNAQWLAAIEKGLGQDYLVAAELKIHRHTVQRKREKHEWLQKAFDDYRANNAPRAEATILRNLDNPKVAMWYLDRKGKHLGYGTNVKVESDNRNDIQYVFHYTEDGRNPYAPGETPPEEPKQEPDEKQPGESTDGHDGSNG